MPYWSSPYLKISMFSALFTCALVFSLKTFAQQPAPKPPIPERPSEMFGLIRERMPLFPGCEDGPDYPTRKKCADSLMIAFIYENLRYPYTAWKDSVQGMAVISFVVEENGEVCDAKTVRDPGQGTGAEALRVVNLMAEKHPRWTPGTQMGKPVRVQFNLPIKFKMADYDTMPPPPPPPVQEPIEMWNFPETMPYIAACDSVGPAERFDCHNGRIRGVIYDNLRWPGPDVCVEGMAVVSFTVLTTGELKDFKIIRDPGAGTGEEALRVVKLMAEQTSPWVPGTQGRDKKRVEVRYNMPVKFSLE